MSTNPRKSLVETPSTSATARRKSRVQIEQQEGLYSAPSSMARQSKAGLGLDPKQTAALQRQSLLGRRPSSLGQGQGRRPSSTQAGGQNQGQAQPQGQPQPQPGPSSKNPGRDSTNLALDSFCASNVVIPPALPDILKQYAKSAMRTDPPDLLAWSGIYFRALANGQQPPQGPPRM